jgi:hypothetical protein
MARFAMRAVIGLACAAFVLGACGGSTQPTVAAGHFAGLWVNPEFNNVVWLHAKANGHKAVLRWEREWSSPVVQQATVQSDGTLKANAVASTIDANGVPAYVGRLTADGHLDMYTTTHVAGVNAAVPVTLHFKRGTQAKYAPFAARMNRNLRQQAVSNDFDLALQAVSVGIGQWQGQHGSTAPPVSAVRPGGAVDAALKAAGKSWPRLSGGALLTPGRGRGHYVYRPLPHGYRLSGRDLSGVLQSTSASW